MTLQWLALYINKSAFQYTSSGPVPQSDVHTGCGIRPKGSPYAGGIFFLDIVFPHDYPFKPPK
eukprot:scaffold80842_cov16-Tisochrysis_lutea.AAC.1